MERKAGHVLLHDVPLPARAPIATLIMKDRVFRSFLTGCAMLAFPIVLPAGLAAQSLQDAESRPVVQPLPPAGVSKLNDALNRLARNSRDIDALLDAGSASLAVNDVDAAIGFFGRAEELSPGNPRIKIGLAAAYTRQQRPLDALRLFDEAERAGASTATLAGDRGLAYDLVGDNVSARQQYEIALNQADDPETRRRLAISHAIAGDRASFETVLAPLIVKQDAASYRTRAFGLAILGDDADAVAIAEAAMPRTLSARIAPYLRYMPRLTKSQQAAAANLGQFPRAAQIGRDDPRLAQYTPPSGVRTADARLAPQGEPLGRRDDTTSERRRPDRGRSTVEAPAIAQASPSPSQSAPVSAVTAAAVPATPSVAASETRIVRADPAVASDPMMRTQAARRVEVVPAAAAAQAVPAAASPPLPAVAASNVPQATVAAPSGSTFDLAAAPQTASATAAAVVTPASTPPISTPQASTPPAIVSRPVVQSAPESVADAFANFSLQPRTGVPIDNGGVDITTFEPPREVEVKPEPKPAPKPAPKPEPPKHPKRFWVQIATGKDLAALKFDWRRISRKSAEILGRSAKGHVTPWGESTRLLAGPYDSLKAAQEVVSKLKESGQDSFTFTSPEGQAVTSL